MSFNARYQINENSRVLLVVDFADGKAMATRRSTAEYADPSLGYERNICAIRNGDLPNGRKTVFRTLCRGGIVRIAGAAENQYSRPEDAHSVIVFNDIRWIAP